MKQQKNKINKRAFTFVELIVTTVILVILASTWFYSYINYLWEARDSERKADLAKLTSSLKLYKQKRWAYPLPWDYFNITNSWHLVVIQWRLNNEVALSTLDKLPLDPYAEIPYFYWVTANKQEYQIALSYENWDFPRAWVEWDYSTVSRNILPNILLAMKSDSNVEIHTWVLDWSTNRHYILFNSSESLPYELVEPFRPYYDWRLLDDVIADATTDFWQNVDYRNCTEILEAWKSISWSWITEQYQILNSSWALTHTWCTFSG